MKPSSKPRSGEIPILLSRSFCGLVIILLGLTLLFFPNRQSFAAGDASPGANCRQKQTSFHHRKPYVEGTLIKSPSGRPLRLHGVNYYPSYLPIDESDVNWLKNQGFNYIRINFYWDSFEPSDGKINQTYLEQVDTVLDLCKKFGLYASLNIHQWQLSSYFTYYGIGNGLPVWLVQKGNYENSSEGLIQCGSDLFLNKGYGKSMRHKLFHVWRFLVQRYKTNPFMAAYELFNEPMVLEGDRYPKKIHYAVMNMYEELTEMIRSLDPETIIIYHWLDPAAERAVPFPNIVWTHSHYYQRYSRMSLARTFRRIKSRYNVKCHTPFIISEMGCKIDTKDCENWVQESFEAARNAGVNDGYEGWAWFHYYFGPGQWGWLSPRNIDGSRSYIMETLQRYFDNVGPEVE